MQDKYEVTNGHIMDALHVPGQTIVEWRQAQIDKRYQARISEQDAKWAALSQDEKDAINKALDSRNKYHDDL